MGLKYQISTFLKGGVGGGGAGIVKKYKLVVYCLASLKTLDSFENLFCKIF
jgi:hypothetical protein